MKLPIPLPGHAQAAPRRRLAIRARTAAALIAGLSAGALPVCAADVPAFAPAPAVPVTALPAAPTTEEIAGARAFEELHVPVGDAAPGMTENRALASALAAYRSARVSAGPSDAASVDLGAFERFLRAYPRSAWRASLWTNLGVEYYHRGEFSKALAAWQGAWAAGKDARSPQAAAVVDRALGEYARMLARLGRVDELRALFADATDRPVRGLGAEAYHGAQGGLWSMENRPEQSFKCGPWALDSILTLKDPAHPYRAKLKEFPSTAKGVPLAAVAGLAGEMKMDLVAARRVGNGVAVTTPAVVHWKLGHYGALLRAEGGRYLLQDPTFGHSQWITQAALDEEASGYFLVASGTLKDTVHWQAVTEAEGQEVCGRGYPSGYPPPEPPDDDGPTCGGMAVWDLEVSEVDLRLVDVPLSYTPPVGPAISFKVSYEQREANQPATLAYSNLGNKWSFDWIYTLTFDSNNAYVNFGRSGQETFAGFTATSQTSGVAATTQTQLVRVSANVFQLVNPDGSMQVFDLYDASGRYYMTKRVDALGNSVKLAYDSQYRLITVTDALGQVSTLSYGNAADAFKITQIADPFGRTAQFNYNANNQLAQITDAVGMTSQFAYAAGSDFVSSLTTGYGTTTFTSTENGLDRTLLVTHPDGSQEMAQSLGGATSGLAFSDPANTLPAGVPQYNSYLPERNTSYWDRKAMLEAPGDPARAKIFHYLHTNNLQKGNIIESIKLPFENRVWFYYQGQQQAAFINTDGQNMVNVPSLAGRVLDDGTTQLEQTYSNALGYPTQTMDPAGRTTQYTYAANNIDLLQVRRVTGLNTSNLEAAYTYNTHHQPLTVTSAAGQTTTNTYNAAGQTLKITNPLQQTTTFTYDGKGYLQSVSGPADGGTGLTTYTYDAYGRVRTSTDVLGYTLTFDYDNLNRPTITTYPDGTTEQDVYTLLNITSHTDRLNRQTRYTYDSEGRQTSTTDPLNRVTQYTYCQCGALSSITDPLGQTTTLDYDVQGRITAKHYPDGSQETFAYEGTSSRLKTRTDAKGQVTAYQYNTDDTCALITYPNAIKPTPALRYTYDPYSRRMTSMTDGTGTTTYTYVTGTSPLLGMNLLASAQGPLGTISYTYDELGRINSRTVDGATETYAYDPLGAVTALTNALGGFSYQYVANTRRPASVTLPNGQTTEWLYYPIKGDSQLKQILHKRPGGATLSQWGYTYNAVDKITSWTQQSDANTPRVYTPTYDAADQITALAVTNPTVTYSYSYDPASNRKTETVNGATVTASFNSLNELNNLTPPPASDRTYEWDAMDRLIAINYTGTSQRTELARDSEGRCVQIVEKTGGTVTSTKRFLWEALFLRAEMDGSNRVTKRFFDQGVQLVGGSSPGNSVVGVC